MAVSKFMKPGRHMKQRVKILTVDPATRRVEAMLKDGTAIQVAIWEVSATFRWPKEEEYWSVWKENGYWMLDSPMDDPRFQNVPVESLNPGDVRIGASGEVHLQGKAIANDGIKIPASAASGKLFTSDAEGNGTWVDYATGNANAFELRKLGRSAGMALDTATANKDYVPAMEGELNPLAARWGGTLVSEKNASAGTMYSARCIVSKTGDLRQIGFHSDGTAAGSFRIGVYDIGKTTAGTLTLIWGSSSTAVSTAFQDGWNFLDPGAGNCPLIAHDHIYVVLIFSSSSAWYLTQKGWYDAVMRLPDGFLPGPSCQSLFGFFKGGSYAAFPSTIADSGVGAENEVPWVLGKIT